MTQETSGAELNGTDHRLPLHARVKDDLMRRIKANEWSSGVPLPSEAQLTAEYDISMGTMRKVLAELAADGIIERLQGKGTFVRRASFNQSLFRFFRQPTGGQTPESRIVDRQEQPASAVVAEKLRLEVGAPVLYLKRLRLRDGAAFQLEDIWLPLPDAQPIAEVELDQLGSLLYPEYEQRMGLVIGSASESLSICVAMPEQGRQLGCAAAEPLVKINRIARTHSGEAAEYRESYGLASSFQYEVEIN